MTDTIHLDFETYSEAGYSYDLASGKFKSANTDTSGAKKSILLVGSYAYAEHHSTEILTASFSFDGGKTVNRWKPGESLDTAVSGVFFGSIRQGSLVHAQNSFFEWCIWNLVGVKKYGFPPLPIEQTRDTAALCYAWGLPGGLDKASTILFGESVKNPDGKRLINRFSIPRNATKNHLRLRRERNAPQGNEAEDWEKFDAYCDQDVRTEAAVAEILPPLSPSELEVWKLDQRINARGILIDLPLVEASIKIMKEAKNRAGAQLAVITGGEITAVSEATKILKWVNSTTGLYLKSLEVPLLTEFLTLHEEKLPVPVVEALNIRLETGGNAPAKLIAMKYQAASDGRVRGVYQYCGAQRTRRWAGRGIQTQNMPNGGIEVLKCERCEQILTKKWWYCSCDTSYERTCAPLDWGIEAVGAVIPSLQTGNYDTVATYWQNPAKAVSGCLRSMLISAPGYDYISSDYSAIEAVVMAVMAGENWIVDIFNGDGKLYERTGAKITGVTVERILKHREETGTHHPARKLGKVASLASQFQGARGAWLKFGAGKFLTNKEIDINVKLWREASPNIVGYWYNVGQAAINAVKTPGETFGVQRLNTTESCFRIDTGVSFCQNGRALYCVLPSGDWLTYVDPKIKPVKKLSRNGWKIIEFCEFLAEKPGEDRAAFQKRQNIAFQLTTLLAHLPGLTGRLKRNGYQIGGIVRKEITDNFFVWGETLAYMGVGLNSQWCEIETYGGKLAENITQATARFILSDAMLRIEAAGYPIVMHTHDEIVSEIPEGYGSIEEFERIMSVMPAWAHDWPIKAAGGWRGKRYRK